MKTYFRRFFGALLAIIMVISMVPNSIYNVSATGAAPQNTYATGDIINYGSYPQTKVTSASWISALNAQTLSADSTVTYDGSKYKRVYFTNETNSYQRINGYSINTVYWFKYEPIQWHVLSNTNGELFVMADKILATNQYNQVDTNVTWETCTMRTWLNDDFYSTAFNSTERAKINTSTVVNTINTYDKLFLLSYAETTNTEYGFNSSNGYDVARRAQGTDYAKSQGLYVSTDSSYIGNSHWWLRTPGVSQNRACNVDYYGHIDTHTYYVNKTDVGVRPAFKINLFSDIFTSKAGSTCKIDYLNSFVYGLSPGITSLVNYVKTAPGFNLEYVTTANGFGTGTVVNVTINGAIVESYTIVIFGDINGDGQISALDALMTLQNAGGLAAFDNVKQFAGDVNNSGDITSLDALQILQFASGMITVF